jgi:hypothetical protein
LDRTTTGPSGLDWPFGELARRALLNRIAQPHKLIYVLPSEKVNLVSPCVSWLAPPVAYQ